MVLVLNANGVCAPWAWSFQPVKALFVGWGPVLARELSELCVCVFLVSGTRRELCKASESRKVCALLVCMAVQEDAFEFDKEYKDYRTDNPLLRQHKEWDNDAMTGENGSPLLLPSEYNRCEHPPAAVS